MNAETSSARYLVWRICAWAGPAYVILEALSWAGVAGFLPPPAEYLTADQTHQYFTDHNLRIRVGMMLTLVFAPLYFVWSAVVSRIIARAEPSDGVLSTIELLGGFGTVVVTWGAVTAWLSAGLDTAAKSPQDIKAVSDLAWMWFNPTAMVTVCQFVAFGTAVLLDQREQPLFPRWMAWFSYAMTAVLLLALLTPLFNRGPFAWHGLFTYYIGLGGYFLWIIFACYFTFHAIDKLEHEERA